MPSVASAPFGMGLKGAAEATGAAAKNAGQNRLGSKLCISTQLNGDRCIRKAPYKFVPYCEECFENGDPSVQVLPHPKFGKMLAAKRALPKGYKMALFGEVFEKDKMPDEDKEWGFETADGYYINPTKYKGSQPQFCQCPGPNERVTVSFNNPHLLMEGMEKGKKPKEKYASMVFQTNMEIPVKHQLVMMYAENEKATESFFAERGITRCDVWTADFPTILKVKAEKAKLKTEAEVPLSSYTNAQISEAAFAGKKGAFNSSSSSSSSSSSRKAGARDDMKAVAMKGETKKSSKKGESKEVKKVKPVKKAGEGKKNMRSKKEIKKAMKAGAKK